MYAPLERLAAPAAPRNMLPALVPLILRCSPRPASRMDSAAWPSSGEDDSDDSDAACLTDDSAAAPSSSGYYNVESAGVRAPHRGRSLLSDSARTGKVVHITTEAELREFGPAVLSQLLGPSMRIKPRKPVNPRISLVF